MKVLKKILQSNKFYLCTLLLTFVYLCLNLFILPKTSKYSIDDKEFILTVTNIRYKEKQTIVEFTGYENLICYYKGNFPFLLGDKVKVNGSLKEANNNTIPNLFNYKKYLYNNNLIYKIKNTLIKRIEKISNNKEYLYAFLLGETYYIDSEVKEAYQFNGVSHLLAIGSSSISIITCIVTYLFHKFKIKDYLYLIIMTILIFVYIILTNYSVSIIRCGLSFVLTYLNKKLKFNIKYQNIIILITSISLIYNPFYIYNLGFQYSYLISFVLVVYSDLIKGNYLAKLLKISTIAYLVSIPINIYNNFEINLLSIILNLIYVPLVNFIIFPLSLLVVLLPFLNIILDIIINITEYITLIFSNIRLLNIVLAKPNIFVIIIYYLAIFYALNGFKKRKYFKIIPLIIIVVIHYNINSINKEDFLLALDVKQGDCLLLKSNNKVALIDTGGSYNYEYSDNITDYLKSIGIRKIDYLFITHGDMDHIGSSYELINKIKVSKVYFNNNDYNDNEKRLIKELEKKRIFYQKISNKDFYINNFYIKAISYNLDNENDSSIVLLIKNKLSLLLMGDASVKTEERLMSDYNLSNFNVLKTGHHGSRTSSGKSFIDKIKPNYSIISVGKNNRYNHPNKEVLNNLKNTKIYRTDLDGSIMFKIKNNKLKIETCEP